MKYFSIFTGKTVIKKALSTVLLLSYVVMPLTPIMPVARAEAATLVTIPDLGSTQSIFNNGDEPGGLGFSYTIVQGSGTIGFHNDQATKDHICQIAGYTANTDGVATTANANDCGQATIISWDGTQWVGAACSSAGPEYVTQVSCGPVTEIVDVCPNIAGAQATVPSGMVKDGSGNCVAINQAPLGSIDAGATCPTALTGWAYDADATSTAITVNLYANGDSSTGTLLGSVTANLANTEANNLGIAGNHGFSFTVPASLKDDHAIHAIYAYGVDTAGGPDNLLSNSGTRQIQCVNGAPTTPTITGPVTGTVGISYTFTFNSTDPEGDMISYGVDWDSNGTIDDSTSEVSSGTNGSLSNTWNTVGSKTFTVYTRDANVAQSAPATHTIVIGSAPVVNPTGTFTASTSSVPRGSSVTLNWNVQNTTGCTASNGWSGAKAASGSENVTVNNNTTYDLSCTNATGGTLNLSVGVTVYDVNYTPVISFSANPTSVSYGGSTDLSWNVTDATSCTASNGWSGTKSLSGTEQRNTLTTDTTYTLTCTGSTGISASSSVSVIVVGTGNHAPTTPTITGPVTGTVGISYTFTFNSTDPEGDMISYGVDWDSNGTIDDSTSEVSSGTNGSLSNTWNTVGSKTFTVYTRDANVAQSAPATHTIVIGSAPVVNPTGTFTASTSSVPRGDTATLTWNIQDADGGCTATGGWSGTKATASSEVTGAINTDTTYNLTCTNSTGGSRTFSVTVTAFDPDYTPVIGSFTASPTSVAFGGYSTLVWSASNASTCNASAVPANALWSGSKSNVSGTDRIEPINATTTFTLTCTGSTGISTSSSVTVTVGTTTGTTTSAVIVTTPADPTTTELGSSVAYTVYLSSRPLTDVTMTVDSSDYTEGTTSVRTLTFTPDNWSVYQTVVVTGVDDALSDGNIVYSLILGATQSVDINYNNLPSQSFNITNLDNEAPVNPVSFVSFTATPGSVATGGTATLAWTATGTISSCEASGDWSGAKSATGTEVVGPISATSTYTIVCTGLGGTATSSVTVGINNGGGSNGTSTVSFLFFNASPLTVATGGTSTLSWSATGTVASCAASGAWSGAKSATGTEVVGPISATSTYTIVCTSTDGTSATSSLTIAIDNGGGNNNGTSTISFVSFTANPSTVAVGGTSTLSWIATGTVATCTAAGGWSGTKSATGTEVVGPLATTTAFTMVCTSIDGTSATSTATVIVNNGGNNNGSSTVSILSFTATPSTISNGGSATLAWTATGSVASCSASGGWSGTKSATGTEGVGPLSATTNYTLVCTGTDGSSATSTVTVTVNNGGGSNGGGGGGTGHRHCVPGITIPGLDCPVEATTTVIVDQTPVTKSGVCQYADFITTYMKKGANNNPDEVTKLQYFLNEYEGASLDLSGIFDDATENAVKNFQSKYTTDILEPWGTTTPTGIVYITTTLKINTIFCTAHPDYNGTIEIKDKTITNVLDTATTTPEFDGAIGAATTTLFGFDNIAGIFGAITAKLIGFLKNIPWYLFTLSLLAITGSVIALGKELKTKFKKEETAGIKDISVKTQNGLKMIAIATVLNILNTVSFITDWTTFNTFAGVDVQSLPIALLVNMIAILAGFASLALYVSNRKA